MRGWMAGEPADRTQGLQSAGRTSQEQKEQGNRAPHLLQDCPGGCRSAPRRRLPQGRADGSVFPATTVALQSHPEQLAGSDALLAVTAPGDAPTVRRIPSWRAPEPLPGLSLQGRGRSPEGLGERLEPFALSAPQAGPGASCLPKLGHCQVWRLRFQFIFFLARSEQPHAGSRARMQSVWAASVVLPAELLTLIFQ